MAFSFKYTNSELTERKSKNKQTNNVVYHCTKKLRYPGINLTKEVKDLYLENYKTLKKEREEDINKWKNILCSW